MTNRKTTTTPTTPPPTETTPPAAPTNLVDRTNEGDEWVTLDWDDNTEADLAGYNIYRAPWETPYAYIQVNTYVVTASDYVDPTAEEDWPYYYRVTAVDTNGNESALSNRVLAKTLCC